MNKYRFIVGKRNGLPKQKIKSFDEEIVDFRLNVRTSNGPFIEKEVITESSIEELKRMVEELEKECVIKTIYCNKLTLQRLARYSGMFVVHNKKDCAATFGNRRIMVDEKIQELYDLRVVLKRRPQKLRKINRIVRN